MSVQDNVRTEAVAGDGGGDGGGDDPQPLQPQLEEDDDRPMSTEELRDLSLHMNMLPAPYILRMLHLIQMRQPELVGDDPTEIVIEFSRVLPSTLRAVREFIFRHIRAINPGPRFASIIRIIQTSQPTLDCGDDNDFLIDFEQLEPSTLWALRRYVDSVFNNQ